MASLFEFSAAVLTNARAPTETRELQTFWKDSACALFFLRRLGCPLCRAYVRMIEGIREEYAKRGIQLICISFEALGEGSDSDRSFEAGAYWNGPLYTIDKSVYAKLFGRKGLFDSFYGLLDMDKEAYQRAKSTSGNLKGDGFQLGGQFIVARGGGTLLLEHRQKRFGDDASLADIVRVLDAV